MAIGYARVEFVKRSDKKNSCTKAAYNSRSIIEFQGNCALDPEVYDWTGKEPPIYHEVILPSGANDKFKNPQVLWNAVELSEKRYNSQVAIELLLALPDDKVITLEDRIYLAKTFVQTHYVDKGLAAQIDIHSPEKRIKITRDNREIGVYKEMLGNIISEQDDLLSVQFDSKRIISFNPKEFTGFIETENNWHAHVLITTRRFDKTGLAFEDHKARDLMPRICKGKVVSANDNGKLWTDHQNKFFQEKGLSLRVDAPGIEPQDHLGPVRMRGRAFNLLEEHSQTLELNAEKSKDPSHVLQIISERQSVFTKEDIDRFINKHLPPEEHLAFKESFWKQKELVPLINKQTGELTDKFSSQKIIDEEASILRIADKIQCKSSFSIDHHKSSQYTEFLTAEQKLAFDSLISGRKFSCLQGYAGTGKSHLLAALKTAYTDAGYNVRAFGPDNATADVLKEKGFQNAENVYRFLYGFYNSKRPATKNNEVWILDEAGKLGNRPLLELLKAAHKQEAQIILSGDNAQLSSVERGGLFRVFCEKYDTPILQDIQRQKQAYQREISKNLASGEITGAIDKLTLSSTIQWSSTKKEAFEALISKWAIDTKTNPQVSTLLIAHSNDEVRVLNEMVRIIKKQRGELSGKELSCETFLGKVYLSPGDQIEFRKKDNDIGVTNGLTGVLVEANPSKFIVAIGRDSSKNQTITFDPQKYNAYQPGYASTYYRSQGKTIDKAYVLHSPALNKRLFYVGLTRHSHEAYYFVSKDQAYCLSDLKRQASRENIKENTLSFTTSQEVQAHVEELKKQQEIQELKESDSFTKKIQGYGLEIYDLLRTKTTQVREHFQDKTLSETFFNQTFSNPYVEAKVEEVSPEPIDRPTQASNVHQQVHPDQVLKKAHETKSNQWATLAPDKKEALQDYFTLAAKASTLRSIIELEIEGSEQGHASASRNKEWEVACGKRNSAAHALTHTIQRDELTSFLGKKGARPIFDQATRYQNFIDENQKSKNLSIETELRNHLEPLLYRIFPEGPQRKNKQEFRFGSKGSLSVICSGEKAGQFYDFERQEGGSMLKLVQRELGLGRLEAQEWAKEFLGIAHDIKVPKAFSKSPITPFKDSEWVSIKPDPKVPAPSFDSISNGNLHHYFAESDRHAYKDENGELLYYRLRLIDKTNPSKKITPPLSYGYWKSNPEHFCWELKGYDAGKAILYNLSGLKQNPLASVLIVEGEKTADKALNKFPGEQFVCVTWPGGAGAARRADWTPLVGRNVIIWPDNDKPGFQAGEDICHELRKIGIQSLRLVDPSLLSKHFPAKWDLADSLPADTNPNLPKKMVDAAIQKGIDPQQVLHRVSSIYKGDSIDRARVNEILWRVDERMRSELERKTGANDRKIYDMICQETSRILLQRSQLDKTFKTDPSISAKILPRLTWQIMVYEANHGTPPTEREITKIKDIIQEAPDLKQSDKLKEFALDKLFSEMPTRPVSKKGLTTDVIIRELNSTTQDLEKQFARFLTIEERGVIQKNLVKEFRMK